MKSNEGTNSCDNAKFYMTHVAFLMANLALGKVPVKVINTTLISEFVSALSETTTT